MTNPDLPSNPSSGNAELQELRQACRLLRTQMTAVLVCVVVFNVSLNLFILKQVSFVHRQSTELRAVLTEYKDNSTPRMNQFLNELRRFASGNKEFAELLGKYPLQTATPTNPPPAEKKP